MVVDIFRTRMKCAGLVKTAEGSSKLPFAEAVAHEALVVGQAFNSDNIIHAVS